MLYIKGVVDRTNGYANLSFVVESLQLPLGHLNYDCVNESEESMRYLVYGHVDHLVIEGTTEKVNCKETNVKAVMISECMGDVHLRSPTVEDAL